MNQQAWRAYYDSKFQALAARTDLTLSERKKAEFDLMIALTKEGIQLIIDERKARGEAKKIGKLNVGIGFDTDDETINVVKSDRRATQLIEDQRRRFEP